MEQERTLEVGDSVRYVDHVGVPHNALITAVWGEIQRVQVRENGEHHVDIIDGAGPTFWQYPSINVVFVDADEDKRDPYGRQIDRDTSVNHRSVQQAPGNFWYWPDEEK